MQVKKPEFIRESKKQMREYDVLIRLIEKFLKEGKPVGSEALKEADLIHLSSATIRNYFSHLEEKGYLRQEHASGGRIPTNAAFRLYVNECAKTHQVFPKPSLFKEIEESTSREFASFLQRSADSLSQHTQTAVFISAPRFDHDFIVDIKLVYLDASRFLCVIISDFGAVQTEVFHVETSLTSDIVQRIENYFRWRQAGCNKPVLEEEEEILAKNLYNELMIRYVVQYSTFIHEEIYRTGFSKLLLYPDFREPKVLADSLVQFEDISSIRLLLRECMAANDLKTWIAEDLVAYSAKNANCSIVAIPYYINNKVVGAVGILGPVRLPYKEIFGVLKKFSKSISKALTKNIYKFKVTFRQPEVGSVYLSKEECRLIGNSQRKSSLEDNSKKK